MTVWPLARIERPRFFEPIQPFRLAATFSSRGRRSVWRPDRTIGPLGTSLPTPPQTRRSGGRLLGSFSLGLVVTALLATCGCQAFFAPVAALPVTVPEPTADSDVPRELAKVSLPP